MQQRRVLTSLCSRLRRSPWCLFSGGDLLAASTATPLAQVVFFELASTAKTDIKKAFAARDEGLTLEQQQKAVQALRLRCDCGGVGAAEPRASKQDAAFQRYLDSLRADAKKAQTQRAAPAGVGARSDLPQAVVEAKARVRRQSGDSAATARLRPVLACRRV